MTARFFLSISFLLEIFFPSNFNRFVSVVSLIHWNEIKITFFPTVIHIFVFWIGNFAASMKPFCQPNNQLHVKSEREFPIYQHNFPSVLWYTQNLKLKNFLLQYVAACCCCLLSIWGCQIHHQILKYFHIKPSFLHAPAMLALYQQQKLFGFHRQITVE